MSHHQESDVDVNLKRPKLVVDADEEKLVNAFYVCGIRPTTLCTAMSQVWKDSKSVFDEVYMSETISRYPKDPFYAFELEDRRLSEFCFPHGIRLKKVEQDKSPHFHSFVMTGIEGTYIYGACLVFYEAFFQTKELSEESRRQIPSPKLSTKPYSDQPFGYVPKAICIVSQWPFITTFEAYLNQLWTYSKTKDSITRLPVEWLVFELIHRVPLPTPGSRLEFGIMEDIACLRPPEKGLPIYDFDATRIFYYLDVENLMTVLKCILLERRLLFYSRTTKNLTFVAETLMKLIFPFEWHHIYIPLLPGSFGRFLDAPVPYIIGTCQQAYLDEFARHKTNIKGDLSGSQASQLMYSSHKTISEDIVFVHLDNNIVLLPEQDPVTKISLPLDATLALKKVLSNFSIFDTNNRVALANDSTDSLPILEIPRDDPVRNLFFNFFTELFKNYQDFIIYPADVSNHGALLGQNTSLIAHFDELEFLCQSSREDSAFFETFFTTNLFQEFFHRKLSQGSSNPAIAFFDHTISKLRANKYPQFKKSPLIEENLSNSPNIIHCDLLSSRSNEDQATFCLDQGRLIHFPELRDEWMPELVVEPLVSDNLASEETLSGKPLRSIDSPPSLHFHDHEPKTPRVPVPLDQDNSDSVQLTHSNYRHLLLRELSSVVKRLVLDYHSLETQFVSSESSSSLGTTTLSKSLDKFTIIEEPNKSQGTLLYIYGLLERIFSHGFRFKESETSAIWSFVIHPQLLASQSSVASQIELIYSLEELRSDVARGRAWIRLACEKKQLASLLEYSIDHHKDTIGHLYEDYAFLRDESCAYGMVAHLMGLNSIDMPLFTNYYRTYPFPRSLHDSPKKKSPTTSPVSSKTREASLSSRGLLNNSPFISSSTLR